MRTSWLAAPDLPSAFNGIVANNHKMINILRFLAKVSPTDANILLMGDTGTGKELIAHAIHNISHRKDCDLVIVNCAAIPDHLLESELFGYKKGAFTDAKEDKKGKIEIANKGTLFLDEIAELSLSSQAKLLRVIENRQLERLGDTKLADIDIRIIAATNANIEDRVKKGSFRSDLFFRLNEIKVEIPILRERKEDIRPLISYFIEQFNEEFNKNVKGISNTALVVLERYDFPGNIRELRSIIKRAMILMDKKKEIIWLEHLPLDIRIKPEGEDEAEKTPSITLREWLENIPIGIPITTEKQANLPKKQSLASEELSLGEMERVYIEKLIKRYKGNKTKVAKILGIDRTTLYKKLKLYNI